MEEPQFRHCTSADGTRIAYAVYGSGPPLLNVGVVLLSMDVLFTLPESRAYFDALATQMTLVTFDRRGTGASARDVDDLSPDAESRDIAAVADAAGLRDVTLFATGGSAAAPCARYAIEHRERVRRIILWGPKLNGAPAGYRAAAASYRLDAPKARRLWAGNVFPAGPPSLQRAASDAVGETLSAEMAARHFEALVEVDFDALLPAVVVPTLVLQREQHAKPKLSATRVADLLPNSRLQLLAGNALAPFPEHEPVVEAILQFARLGERPSAAARPRRERGPESTVR
jgi:pimeloyl-ACP methyl ester carboxylesterase